MQNVLDQSVTDFQNKTTLFSEDQLDDYSLADLKEAQKIYEARIQALLELESGTHDPDHNPELDLEQSSTWHKGDIFTFETTQNNTTISTKSAPLENDSTTVGIPKEITDIDFWNIHFYVRLNGTLQSSDYQYTLDITNKRITKKSVNLNEFKQMLDRMVSAKQKEVDRLAVYDNDGNITGGAIYEKLQEIEEYGKQVNFEEWLMRSAPDGYGANKDQAKAISAELNQYTKEQVYTNNDIGVAELNEDIGSVEYYNAMQSLLKSGRNAFASMWQPPIQFNVDLIDFLSCLQCQDDWDRFSLGDIIHIRHSLAQQPDFTVRLVGIKYNPMRNDLSGEFSNQDNLKTDEAFALELFKNAQTASVTVSNNKGQWSNAEQNAVDTIRGSIIDTAKQRISGANDGVTIDSRGITVSSKLKAYEDYQTRISAGVICTTEKNGQLIKAAMVNGDLVAERIVGTQLVGNQLIISANKYDDSGEKGIMTMLVNGEGVKLSNGGLTIEDIGDGSNGITLTPEGGLTVTCKKKDVTAKFNATDGILIKRGNETCVSFDTSSNNLLVNGEIRCKNLYLGNDTESVLTKIDNVTKIKGGVISPDGIEMKSGDKNIFKVSTASANEYFKIGDGNYSISVNSSGRVVMGGGISLNWSQIDDGYSAVNSILNTTLEDTYQITHTRIDGTQIESPTIRGGTIVGGTFIANSMPSAAITGNDTPGYARMIMNQNGIECKNKLNELNGIRLTANSGFGKLEFYYRDDYRGELSQDGGDLILKGDQQLIIGNKFPEEGRTGLTKAVGKWDFSGTTQLTGIKATFA